jgi:predicted dehydrogenase
MMRVGVIGTGFGRRVVAPVFAATDGCTVVDVVSARDEDAVLDLARRADVDLVSVHSPPFLHAPHVRAALVAGKAVLCDKPFALDADEAAALEAEAQAAGVVALCNFEFRYAPARALLRETVQSGELGRVEHVQWTHLSSGSRVPVRRWGWLFDAQLGGGWIGAWGSHAVDAIRWMFGEVAGVDAVRRIDVRERPDASGVERECTAEDGFIAALVVEDATTVAIDSGFAAATTFPSRLTVFGAEAACEVVNDHVTVRRADGSRVSLTDSDGPANGDPHLEPMRRFAEVVRDAVRTGEIQEHAPTFTDGRACDAVLEQLRAAPLARSVIEPDAGR